MKNQAESPANTTLSAQKKTANRALVEGIKKSFEVGESDYDRLLHRINGMIEWANKQLESVRSENDQITERELSAKFDQP